MTLHLGTALGAFLGVVWCCVAAAAVVVVEKSEEIAFEGIMCVVCAFHSLTTAGHQ